MQNIMYFFSRIGRVILKQFQQPWLRNQKVFALTALGREHDQLLKTLHSFTDDVSLFPELSRIIYENELSVEK